MEGTDVIGTHEAGFAAASRSKKRGMVTADVVKGTHSSVIISTHHVLYLP